MNIWDFKTVRIDPRGKAVLTDLCLESTRLDRYIETLEIALKSVVPNPQFSHYFVKESIGFAAHKMLSAGNIEYGLCQALHGEETAVAALRAQYGRAESGEIILGIIAGNPGNIATPCGNCRDIMLEDLGDNFEIVSGASCGGIAVVTNIKDYLFSAFRSLAVSNIPQAMLGKIETAIKQGALLVNDAYSPQHIHPERRYHALISTHDNSFVGAHDVMCDYHPMYALRDAIRQARRINDPCVQSVVIVCKDFGGGPPHVMYKDRQHLAELNTQAELLTGKENDPPVFLATYNAQGGIINAWQTSVKEWIPFVFTPRNFGPELIEHLTNYFQGLGRQ